MNNEVSSIYKNHGSVKFLVGKWKTLLLVHENFIYQRFNGHFPKTAWQCTAKDCSTTVYTNDGKFEEENGISPHYHPPATDDIVLLEAEMKIKKRVKTEFNLSPRQIHT